LRDRLKELSTGVAIYGAGDAAIQVVNFALLAVYVKGGHLSTTDYGALAIIGALEAFAKVASRLGLDGAFMRYYHERGEGFPRMASTIVWFLLVVDVILLAATATVAGWLGPGLFEQPHYVPALQLMLLNTFLIAFTFVPFHAMRLRGRPVTYSAFTFARSVGTVVLRILLVINLGFGLIGIYVADLLVTLAMLPWLWPWFKPFFNRGFSGADLRVALRFSLPRVPHGLAQQTIDGGNKLLFSGYITQPQLGVYQNAVTLGTGVKFFTSAFETAWAPFYYATARQPDAKVVLRKVTTYGFAVLVLLVAGTVAIARDVVLVMLTAEYLEAAPILPLVAAGMGFQGIYLLTSIGLNLTSRTEFYPLATFAAAGVGLAAGVVLMPTQGAVGAATAFALAYATQAIVAFYFAQRFYPISYEGRRLLRIAAAGFIAAATALWAVPPVSPVAGLLLRGILTVGTYAAVLFATGFFRTSEWRFARELVRRRSRAPESARVIDDAK
jgi:O-antigen/teichoic acid export membrane protein